MCFVFVGWGLRCAGRRGRGGPGQGTCFVTPIVLRRQIILLRFGFGIFRRRTREIRHKPATQQGRWRRSRNVNESRFAARTPTRAPHPPHPSPAAGSRRSSLRPHPQHALRHPPPLRPHPRAPQHPRKAVAQRLPPRALSSASPSAPSRQRSAPANPRDARFFRILKSLLLYYGRVLK